MPAPESCSYRVRCPWRIEKCLREPELALVEGLDDHRSKCWRSAEVLADSSDGSSATRFVGGDLSPTSMSRLNELAEELWEAREYGTLLADASVELDVSQATHVLKTLTQMSLRDGDDIIGWKIGGSDQTVPFAAPVFKRSLRELHLSRFCSLRFELEFVASVGSTQEGIEFDPEGWRLGLELIDSHSSWRGSPLLAMADWGMHAGAAIGDSCPIPVAAEEKTARVVTPQGEDDIPVGLSVDIKRVTKLLAQYCPLLGRECIEGDIVFTGAMFGSRPIPVAGEYTATIDAYGQVSVTIAP